ncbi:hypothetical protein Agub_g1398 [Astrephomene gubernaculifera]|uniref:Uncharacterized protein n=1 Tax=Astrephomene gubernaculifera TaxID=47775 RepID=A0AAD3DFS9_9CHLO|nr:hypothetical protein Agub_g1398 [Astrephomene gubernaculifera]
MAPLSGFAIVEKAGAPMPARASNPSLLQASSQRCTSHAPIPAIPIPRRTALAVLLAPIAASLLDSPDANATANNVSRTQLLLQQRAARKEEMRARNAKIRCGEAKPQF